MPEKCGSHCLTAASIVRGGMGQTTGRLMFTVGDDLKPIWATRGVMNDEKRFTFAVLSATTWSTAANEENCRDTGDTRE